ncbi:MAG: hypothetical protein PUP92_19895, partial [Rhizonema sp. PD38]|nr:hypothetical protein [Rhizonema sp. PD38]
IFFDLSSSDYTKLDELTLVYAEHSKTETVTFLLKEINDLPITEELKLKLKDQISPSGSTYTVPTQEPGQTY